MLMLIMVNWSLELLSVFFLAINLVLKAINYGILKLRRLKSVGISSLMNLLCYMIIWPPILLLRNQVFRWSTLLIQLIHQKIKILLFKMHLLLKIQKLMLIHLLLSILPQLCSLHNVLLPLTDLEGLLIHLTDLLKNAILLHML